MSDDENKTIQDFFSEAKTALGTLKSDVVSDVIESLNEPMDTISKAVISCRIHESRSNNHAMTSIMAAIVSGLFLLANLLIAIYTITQLAK